MSRVPEPLSLDRIVNEAIALVDEEGPDSLSMRKLAHRLGTSTMATYHHVADREELVEAMVQRVIGTLDVPGPEATWQEAVTVMATSFRSLSMQHPGVFRLTITDVSPAVFEHTSSQVLGLLTLNGFDPPTAIAVYRTLVRYLVGSLIAEQRPAQQRRGSPAGGSAAAADDQFQLGLAIVIRGAESLQ
jgi:AcrR family transcriptional regulator